LAAELHITAQEYQGAKRLLQELDVLEERKFQGKPVLVEKVQRLDHAANYERLGESWELAKNRSHKEQALVHSLDSIILMPAIPKDVTALADLSADDLEAVLELAKNAAVLDSVNPSRLLYSPLLWDIDPKKLTKISPTLDKSKFKALIDKVMKKPGSDLSGHSDPVAAQVVSAGILPTYNVKSSGKEKKYSFAPYAGALLTSAAQKSVLEKARAIVACLRFGNEAASITKIRSPGAILYALLDATRGHRVGYHSELKEQYGMLVKKGIGRIEQAGDRYAFVLIPTEDNLLACRLATELITSGQVLGDKDPLSAQAALHLVSGEISHPIREVSVAKKRRPARADDLAGIVEAVRQVQ
ncbi:MAG TPA: hypothetical protein VG944_13190, partial [Fimbriimonas sp.]|nr:hypothetical protein [Fimbriimonas sp.]